MVSDSHIQWNTLIANPDARNVAGTIEQLVEIKHARLIVNFDSNNWLRTSLQARSKVQLESIVPFYCRQTTIDESAVRRNHRAGEI